MADTRMQMEVESWIRASWLPAKYGQSFQKARARLSPGGVFEFDAVSEDKSIIATISTAGYKTAGGKPGSGKMHKIRSDAFFLLTAEAPHRLVLLTEQDMFEQWNKERAAGRVPAQLEFVHVDLPLGLATTLREARERASEEVSPRP